jgi:prepilin-type N-terminal cleavage/methylation domain-containing protein
MLRSIYQKTRKQGFTLVELSIVIIIIGFLIAGVSSGRSLVIQSKLGATANEIVQIRMAMATFKSIYEYLPGDLPYASSYWPNCALTPSNCNGNGDGVISPHNGEGVRLWQQLGEVGLINGKYPGTLAVNFNPVVGVEVPASKWGDGSGYLGVLYGFTGGFDGIGAGNVFNLGKGNVHSDPIMSPVDAYNIDIKIDDGLPRQGIIWIGGGPSLTSCYYSPDFWYIPSSYNISLTDKVCVLHILFNDLR